MTRLQCPPYRRRMDVARTQELVAPDVGEGSLRIWREPTGHTDEIGAVVRSNR